MKPLKYRNCLLHINENGSEILSNGKLLNQYIIKGIRHLNGFKAVTLLNQSVYVHQLVARAYVYNPRPVSFKIVHHIDGNTLNNHFNNLLWGNRRLINRFRVENGIKLPNDAQNARNGSKITHYQALRIAVRLEQGEIARSIAKEFDVSEMTINRIRKRYCHTKNVSKEYPKSSKEIVLQLLITHEPSVVAKTTGIPYHTIWRWKNNWLHEKNTHYQQC